ncbi:GNAT family N-acetyltransferase [Tropicibacter naphthalenivorans]|uniref:N-acetyltransferase domain-containing protein n=1 Tax=Tropicibacter naphthalenivorans TaxID=441103 RepID=A0A0P1FZL8_9RHOB|nr:GNAT family N-acetyltransferase [Tropicibacter naphthalenivorans]CUH74816.1 hypothetical protein TRN7648_00099 [Tropicibacter naphthalenivorans]SMC48811.1 Protein N-acetyltransferase, RimJ/RimL family [Tropicibacter naphthalenivorans]
MLPQITLTTARLTLRTPIEADFEAAQTFMSGPRSVFVGGPHTDAFTAWRGFLAAAGTWALKGFGYFTVLHGDSIVGRVGLGENPGWDEPELGWHLYDGCEGHGYATEAALAARDWAYNARGLGPLISYIAPGNASSRAVAQRLGAHLERTRELMGKPAQVWRHGVPA